jgi:hypothetical protein
MTIDQRGQMPVTIGNGELKELLAAFGPVAVHTSKP